MTTAFKPHRIGFAVVAVLLVMGSARPADATLITVTQVRDFDINLGVQSLNWNQHDRWFGVLTSVLYSVDGELTGSFVCTNLSTLPATVRNSSNFFEIDFVGSTAPDTFPGSTITIPTSPLTDSVGTIVGPGVSQLFTIVGNPALVVPEVELISFIDYFTGTGTINSNISQTPQVTMSGDNFTVNMGNVRTVGTATLIYVYDSSTAIPEPFTVAFTGGIIGFGALAGWRRRRSAAVRAEPVQTVAS